MPLAAPQRLRTDYRQQPLGLGNATPLLMWEIADDRRGAVQSAWQIQAGNAADLVAPLWDSGQVRGDRSHGVAWAGPALSSRQRVWWRVRTWDGAGQASPWSAVTWFEMGLLQSDDWRARWIGGSRAGGPTAGVPAPTLRTVFRCDKPVVKARLYITAAGLYDASINGQPVGDLELVPGWTDFAKRVVYQVYDVTALVQSGDNAMGAVLGDGWWCGHVGPWGRQRYGDRPGLLAQLEVTHVDGSVTAVLSDGSWRWSDGANLANDLLMGQSDDARRDLGAWNRPGYNDRSWLPVADLPAPSGCLVAQDGHHTVRQEILKPVAAPVQKGNWDRERFIYDFGQNLVGRLRLTVDAPAGTVITLRHAEVLDKDGSLYVTNLRSAKAIDEYVCRGGGPEVFEPKFTVHGFRYAEVGALKRNPVTEIVAVVLHADLPESGDFRCSDAQVNQLQKNIVWGQKGNFLEVPTDCPQRDERLGWTGDAQVFARTAGFNRDVGHFFRKWLGDLADGQKDDGAVPCIAPPGDPNGHGDGGPAWSDAVVIVPWTCWRMYGDEALLASSYSTMAKYVDQLVEKTREKIRSHPVDGWGGFGDWLALDGSGKIDGGTPKDLIGTAFLAEDARLMAEIAGVLGKTADVARWHAMHEEVKRAFVERYITAKGLIAGQTQTAYVLALAFNLMPESGRAEAGAALVRDIEGRGDHLSTGFVGTPHLPHVLTAIGRSDVAYKLLFQKTWPSWLYPVTQGATTIWERWDGWTHDKGFQDASMNSFNHYAYGAIGAWMYQVVAGLDLDPNVPAYKRIVIRPRPGGGLTHARARLHSVQGNIISGWTLIDGRLDMEVAIPANTSAVIHIPATAVDLVRESGKPLSASEGLTVRGLSDGAVVVETGAGRYAFSVLPAV